MRYNLLTCLINLEYSRMLYFCHKYNVSASLIFSLAVL